MASPSGNIIPNEINGRRGKPWSGGDFRLVTIYFDLVGLFHQKPLRRRHFLQFLSALIGQKYRLGDLLGFFSLSYWGSLLNFEVGRHPKLGRIYDGIYKRALFKNST
jgi:hypothetical protein